MVNARAPEAIGFIGTSKKTRTNPRVSVGSLPTTAVCRQCQDASVKLKLRTPIDIVCKSSLFFLIQHAGFQHEEVHLSAHEATIAVLRRAYDRLAAHVETGVDDHRTSRLLTK